MIATNTNVKLLFQGLGPQLASFREALGKHSEYLCCSTYWDENVPFKDDVWPKFLRNNALRVFKLPGAPAAEPPKPSSSSSSNSNSKETR